MIDQHIIQVLQFSPDIQVRTIEQRLTGYTPDEIAASLDRLVALSQVGTYDANIGRKRVTRYRLIHGTLGGAIQSLASRIEKHERWAKRMKSDLATIEAKTEELRSQYEILREEQSRLQRALPGNEGWAA
jgi:chromosome segregation ATPase